MRPIRRWYKETFFRSTLEARWAVFFDHMGIPWVYEPRTDELRRAGQEIEDSRPGDDWDESDWEDYHAGSTWIDVEWYSPDFYLPHQEVYIEIKPREPNEAEIRKAAHWITDGGEWPTLFFFFGPIETGHHERFAWKMKPHESDDVAMLDKHGCWLWTECLRCGKLDITGSFNPPQSCEGACYTETEIRLCDLEYEISETDLCPWSCESPRLLTAYKKARSHKF